MRILKRGVQASACALVAFMAVPALAQSKTAAEAWNSPYSGPSANDRAASLAEAEAMLRARERGYGPAQSTTNIGTYNETTTYNGPATNNSSSSTNIVNSNSTSNQVTGSSNTISVMTGQTSGQSSQDAKSVVSTGAASVIGVPR